MAELILEKYTYYITEERQLSTNTVDAYISDAMQFDQYLKIHSKYNLLEINKTAIITYLSYLQKEGKSISTISRNLASLRSLYQYLLNNNFISEDPTFNLKSPKGEKKFPDILTKDEVDLLISQTNASSEKGLRDRAIIQLIYSVGLRVSEIIDLNIVDFNLDSGLIKLRQDDMNRILSLNNDAIRALNEYLEEYRPDCGEDDPLFVNLYGERLTRQGVWKIFKQYSKSIDIDKDITPHVLRHSFAISMLDKGVSLIKIQKMLGHSDLSTIQSYQVMLDE